MKKISFLRLDPPWKNFLDPRLDYIQNYGRFMVCICYWKLFGFVRLRKYLSLLNSKFWKVYGKYMIHIYNWKLYRVCLIKEIILKLFFSYFSMKISKLWKAYGTYLSLKIIWFCRVCQIKETIIYFCVFSQRKFCFFGKYLNFINRYTCTWVGTDPGDFPGKLCCIFKPKLGMNYFSMYIVKNYISNTQEWTKSLLLCWI